MKKQLLTLMLAGTSMAAFAQATVADSVELGAGYANQAWYSLQTGQETLKPKTEWDIAFNIKDITSPIFVNTATGVVIKGYPKADLANGWSSVDTTGYSTWPARMNSDTSWALGAIGAYADPNDATDLDWGKYDMTTHFVNGDSLFIVRLQNGSFKKLAIVSLISGTYTFRFADLNGSNEQTKTLAKSAYAGKNFAYYSLQNDAALDREPLAADWDLLFTQYNELGTGNPMPVTGVLQNRLTTVAEARDIANTATYNNYGAHSFETAINIIGRDWKTYDYVNNVYTVEDSLVYFVNTAKDDIWKLVFTGFSSSTGKFVFSKQRLVASNVRNVNGAVEATVSLYPNPANGQNITVVYDLNTAQQNANLRVLDISGRTVVADVLETRAGLHQYILPSTKLNAGMYVVVVSTATGSTQQKLIVQ